MTIETFFLLGALGGSFRGVISFYGDFASWHQARRAHSHLRLSGQRVGPVPRLAEYIDALPEIGAAVVHILLGGLAGIVFGATGQVAGIYATVLVGASAPALLTQMGQFKFVKGAFTTNTIEQSPRVPAQGIPQSESLRAIIPHGERTIDDI